MHRYVLVEEPGFGVALTNDSMYGYDVIRNVDDAEITTTLRLSLLRAPRFPDPETDQGVQTHVFGMVIGADAGVATEEGLSLNLPGREICGARAVEPLVANTGDGTVVSGVKLADDRSGDLIVRVYEGRGRRESCSVSGPLKYRKFVKRASLRVLVRILATHCLSTETPPSLLTSSPSRCGRSDSNAPTSPGEAVSAGINACNV